MEIERAHFRNFVTNTRGILHYIENIRKDGVWGDDIEVQVLSEIYDVKIEIYDHSKTPIKTFNPKASQTHKIIRLLYLQLSHYDSLHKLSEPLKVIEGSFGTLEASVIELAKERNKQSSYKQTVKLQEDRGDIDRDSKRNMVEAMKESMKTFNEEKAKNQNIISLEDSILKQAMEESKQQNNSNTIPPIQQVVNMGYPIELVLKAYSNVGSDVERMINYIYTLIN